MFFGRKNELTLLKEKYNSSKSELTVLYGRRRIGKTSLIAKFIKDKPYVLNFEGIEGEQSNFQINQVAEKVIAYTGDPFIDARSLNNWNRVFTFITEKIIKNKRRKVKFILFFDEIQWMACGRSRLIAIIKYFWDNFWKNNNVMLILCGSIASFMINKVISSKALYGRITTEMLLKGLGPDEAATFFKGKKSIEEILKYLMIFGGVPKYLEEINLNKSFNQNINSLCFSSNSYMVKEIEKIFYSQFRKSETYIRIINLLKNSLLTLNDIAVKLGKKSGGSLRSSIEHLENAEFIASYFSFDKGWKTKYKKYRLSDEYLTFYFKFMEPHIKIISDGEQKKLFEMITKDNFKIWLGFAFERFCLKHAFYLSKKMNFADQVISYGPYFSKKENKFQIDLIYKRIDNTITICEVKYHSGKISTDVIKNIDRKISLLSIPRGFTIEKALISLYGPDIHLQNTEYFNHYVTIEDIFN